ncbi:mechanosensitive ion channel family protein [Dysgonomonas sp. ZJ709]|uniref:mechanosensitive ion channel family protein n=1 Tax=Dysgonomonas sp. ZJ709 TaxID=2709797 RepID=UPI0013ED56C7|nr:mechanosensitive ion channel domain-containing protein [Dysgonomonas sp. ZJ709]
MEAEQVQTDFDDIIISINSWMQELLTKLGVAEQWIIYTKLVVLLVIVATASYLLQLLVRKLLIFVSQRITKVTSISFFKYGINNRLPHYLALIVPYSFVRSVIPIIFFNFKSLIVPCLKIADIYMVFMVIWTVMAVIKSFGDILQEKPAFHNKPMKSYMQVIQMVLFIFGAVAIFSIVTGKSAMAFFAAMGAASAVLLLMFKDSIMGFVGSIQISTNNMVQIGDWITMNKYGADGSVEEITLTTVKVRNFDKTITTIPTYALISDSFQNWRGMQESGGRRIKKAIYIKQSDIRFLRDEELDKFKHIDGLGEFIAEHKNNNKKIEGSSPLVIGPRITNNDLFMQYGIYYLRHHPKINKTMTLMVRQLAPTPEGLPVELYTFTDTVVWAEYEAISTEIFNHLISVVKYFDLQIFESSSGSDDYNVYMRKTENG